MAQPHPLVEAVVSVVPIASAEQKRHQLLVVELLVFGVGMAWHNHPESLGQCGSGSHWLSGVIERVIADSLASIISRAGALITPALQ